MTLFGYYNRKYGGILSSSITDILLAAFLLVSEAFLSVIWRILPLSFLEQWVQNVFVGPKESDPNLEKDFVELAESLFGPEFQVQEHHTVTKDGYILGIHRIIKSELSGKKGVVFIMHGLMQSSEAWIASGKRSLPYMLASEGYEVWLGNNRGNKYSHKHIRYSPNENAFWDFCIDNLALDDIPTMINYVLQTSGSTALSYIGFSNGTAQGFAALSSNPDIAKKVNIFIAMAPCTRVKGLSNRMVRSLTTSRPGLVFLLFGRRALLPETLFWRKMLTTPVYIYVVDRCMNFLFGWNLHNIKPEEKPVLYSHIYSFSSVKTLVHWFQITRVQRFQMFDSNLNADNFEQGSYRTYLIPNYNLAAINCPIALFYGGRDTIPDVSFLLTQLPKSTFQHKEEDYEHIDFMWSKNAHERVFPKVINLISEYL